MNDSVNANELISAGHNFRFCANDGAADFDDCDCRKTCKCPRDGITGAKGFRSGGEVDGFADVGRRSTFDVEAELHTARLQLEDLAEMEDSDELTEAECDARDAANALLAAIDGADGDHRSTYFSSSEGLVTTDDLATPYWDEVADAHIAEMRDAFHKMWVRREDVRDAGKPLPGEMEYWAKVREGRFDRLRVFAKRTRKAGDERKLAALKAGVQARYAESAALVKRRGKAEWHLLYLTSAQVSYLLRV